MTLPKRPAHWLPHEPIVWELERTADGFAEVVLELGGRYVATGVVSCQDSCRRCLDDFAAVIRAEIEKENGPCCS